MFGSAVPRAAARLLFPLPVGIAAGPDGALWFTGIGAGRIGRIFPDGAGTELPLADPGCRPYAVVAGPVGDCWYTGWATDHSGRAGDRPSAAGHRRPPAAPAPEPHGLAFGRDGALYLALEGGAIVRCMP
ncbi:hypothetical protein GCM10010302_30140 [Streptomyces polychromogenes]|uniref:Virginiamycin B lyase n=1 Tax=Streptomyces polychromogenes TaxID=67342 RepID=A0ABP3F301_9ACTN